MFVDCFLRIASQSSFGSSTMAWAYISAGDTVHGQNPALAGSVRTLWSIGDSLLYINWCRIFVHQQYPNIVSSNSIDIRWSSKKFLAMLCFFGNRGKPQPALETFPVALDDQDEAGAVMSFLVSWLISYQFLKAKLTEWPYRYHYSLLPFCLGDVAILVWLDLDE